MKRSKKIQAHESLRRQTWRQFRKNKPALVSLYVLAVLAAIALLAPLLANSRPLYCRYEGHTLFPAFSCRANYVWHQGDSTIRLPLATTDWKHLPLEKAIWPPVPYSSGALDYQNAKYVSPGGSQHFRDTSGKIIPMPARFRHRLGTNKLGQDVLAGLIHGARISMSIGLLAMAIASFIGLLLGALAGYFGDRSLHTTRGRFWTIIIGIFIAWFYAFHVRHYALSDALSHSPLAGSFQLLLSLVLFAAITWIFAMLGKFISRIPALGQSVYVPLDSLISRTIEIINSLPLLILIITIAAITKPSLGNVMILIGLTNWTGIARLTRAEFLKIRSLEYMEAARSLGYSRRRMIWKHALPNGLAPASVNIAFGIAAAILIESSLSFLGIGVPPGTISWGALVNAGRENYSAWWLVVFPGLAIFITVTAYNLIGEGLRDALDPRLRQ